MAERAAPSTGGTVVLARIALTLIAGVAACLIAVPTSASAAPGNDNLTDAVAIDPGSLPTSIGIDATDMTLEQGEPTCSTGDSGSIWYTITPTQAETLRLSVSNSFFVPEIAVWKQTGPGIPGLGLLPSGNNCTFYGPLNFKAQANTTYAIQILTIFNQGGPGTLNVSVVPPPVNDNFADATSIDALPFRDTVDLTAATLEPGEPVAPPGAFTPLSRSVWYTYTAPTDAELSVYPNACCDSSILEIYTGSSLAKLTPVAGKSGDRVIFNATAGTTYHFQVGFGPIGNTPRLLMMVDVVPPPVTGFFWVPDSPAPGQEVQFFDQTYDNGQVGIRSEVWDFGDGTTETNPGFIVSHTYQNGGSYTVSLSVTANDGQTVSAEHTIQVGDATPPVLTVPSDITVDATNPDGAAVTYSVTASDPDDAVASLKCAPGSGSTFPLGTTTVTCTATDTHGNTSTATFTVHVKGASEQLTDLAGAVAGIGPGTSLADKVSQTQSYLTANDKADACSTLTAFINQVKAQTGKAISASEAATLTADALQIKTVLGC